MSKTRVNQPLQLQEDYIAQKDLLEHFKTI